MFESYEDALEAMLLSFYERTEDVTERDNSKTRYVVIRKQRSEAEGYDA